MTSTTTNKPKPAPLKAGDRVNVRGGGTGYKPEQLPKGFEQHPYGTLKAPNSVKGKLTGWMVRFDGATRDEFVSLENIVRAPKPEPKLTTGTAKGIKLKPATATRKRPERKQQQTGGSNA